MADRSMIFARIREALRVAAPLPAENVPSRFALPQFNGQFRAWLPVVGESIDDRIALFAKNSTELKTDFQVARSIEEARDRLRALADEEGWASVATHAGELTDTLVETLELPRLDTSHGYDLNALEKVSAGITQCDALVAQTGGVLITARSAGGRALSVLPPHHVVLARIEQLVPDLPAAYDLLQQKYAGNYPSLMSFITGPSRTGDIERVLVLGAHGPKKLTVILIRS